MDRKGIFREFVAEALKREHQGLSTYGEFDPETDDRILTVEAQEEALDSYVYLKMLVKKFPALREKVAGCMQLSFNLYFELRKLERLELQETPKKGGGS